MSDGSRALQVFRAEHAPVFAALWRKLGEFDLIDAAMADAYLAAQAAWPSTGIPQNPAAWMSTVAMSATTSVLARRGGEVPEPSTPADDVRALVFACCHPRLTADERVVCLVRAAVGLVPHEIAALLGVPEMTVTARLNAAKRTLRQPGVGFAMIPVDDRAARAPLVQDAAAQVARVSGAEAAAVNAILAARVAQAL